MVAGWAAANIAGGLIATLGTFTSRFGSGRPYLNRGAELAVVAVALAAAVTLGTWAAAVAWAGIITITVVAVVAVWLCNALAVGPPGAYVFVVACAAGVGVSAAHLPPWQIGLLVLAGGAVAWLVQMAPALAGYRKPERAAVDAAAGAVAAYADAYGTERETQMRHAAATALHRSWSVLVNYQPFTPARGSMLHRLRAANHALHVLFTNIIGGAATGDEALRARQLGALQLDPGTVATRDDDRIPLGRPSTTTQLVAALTPGSHVRHVMTRVAIGVPLAGALAVLFGVGHPYWAMAAAVLVLHQGNDRHHTLRRGGQRLLGTWVGLLLAGAILAVHPQGLWLALVLVLLQFTIELLVVRNYALASVFITAAALTISSGTHRVDIGDLLLSRGTDTLIGCAVGAAVYLAMAGYQETSRLPGAVATVIDAVAETCSVVARDDSMTTAARASRRDLQIAALALREADDAARLGSAGHRGIATRMAATVAATEHVAYRTLAACWATEHRGAERLFGDAPVTYPARLHELADTVRTGAAPPAIDDAPAFMTAELTELRSALRDS